MRKVHNNLVLKLEGLEIPVVEKYRFDRKKTILYSTHKKTLKQKCNKALVAHRDWEASQQTLMKLYRPIICSKLNHGCMILESARKSYLKTLDVGHHEGISICPGSFLYLSNREPLCEKKSTTNKTKAKEINHPILPQTKILFFQFSM